MIKRTVVGLISLLIVVALGYAILTPPSVFNFIPFAIHESMLGGTAIEEHQFIIGFDLLILLLVFIILNRIPIKMLR